MLTKADLASALELELAAAVAAARLRRLQRPFPFLVALSARTGEGVATLQHTLLMASGLLARPAPQAAVRTVTGRHGKDFCAGVKRKGRRGERFSA